MRILTCGFAVLDIIAAGLERLPEPGETLFAPLGVKFWIGGHPVNVSVDLMQLGCARGEVAAVLAVGKDIAGEFIRRKLEESGVLPYLQLVDDADTGRSLVLVLRGRDRSFIGSPGANLRLSLDHVVDSISEFSPDVFYLACGILGEFDYAIDKVLELCRSRGMITVLDVARPYGKGWDFLAKAFKHVDIFHANVGELSEITGLKGVAEGMVRLHELGVRLPIVTDGRAGAFLLARGRCLHQPSFEVEAVDPTGAGDAFCAGLIKFIADRNLSKDKLVNLSVEEYAEMLLLAQAAGAACVEGIGTTTGVRLERVTQLLESQGDRILSSTAVKPC